MESNRNNSPNNGPNKPGDNKSPKNNIWITLMIAVAVVFVISGIYNMISNSSSSGCTGASPINTPKDSAMAFPPFP